MTDSRFVVLSHTADKAIGAYGSDPNELFENAAYGMFSLMADLAEYEAVETRHIEVDAADLESLLRSWLAELLFQFEVEHLLFVDFRVTRVEPEHMEADVRVVPFSQGIEWLGSIVKAVTYHDLDIHQTDGRWEATIVFDV